ncbi:hypothetical protein YASMINEVIRUS_12, partial [Yasminevirus sp. GU-2018]
LPLTRRNYGYLLLGMSSNSYQKLTLNQRQELENKIKMVLSNLDARSTRGEGNIISTLEKAGINKVVLSLNTKRDFERAISMTNDQLVKTGVCSPQVIEIIKSC